MKKHWKFGLVGLIAITGTAAACFAACDKKPEEPKHDHSYSSAWKSDADYHWHEADCEHTDLISDKAAHIFAEKMEYDGTNHWYECSVCERKKDEAPHVLVDGVCECGYVDPASRLVYTLSGSYYEVALSPAALKDQSLTSIEIPEEHEGKKVRWIAENGFNGAKYLKTVSLPKSIWYIKDYAFEDCVALTSIEFPAAVLTIGNQAFAGCTSLAGTIKMPDNVQLIGENLFLNCEKLQGIEFAAGTTRIGTQAFANCKALTSITIPDTVTYIGMKAFKGTGLTEVTVPSSVTTLSSYVFEDCAALTTATISADLEYITGSWFNGCTALETLTLPFVGQDVHPLEVSRTGLGFAFGTNAYGTDATVAKVEQSGVTYYIPKSLKTLTVLGGYIKEGAFDNCSMLEEITLKRDVVAEADTFENCTADFNIEFPMTVDYLRVLKGTDTVESAMAGEELKLEFAVSKFATFDVSIWKGSSEATSDDYTYNAETGKLVFNTAGSYKITVNASHGKDNAASRTVNITITLPAPELSEVTLNPATAELTGESVSTVISYTADNESVITVVVKKDGNVVQNAYDAATKTVTVSEVGTYSIEVTAERNGLSVNRVATFIVSNPSAPKPEVTLTSSQESVAEGTSVTITANITYPEGATKKDETFEFFVQNGSNFENADTNNYTWDAETKAFTPKVAGTYQIKLTALTQEGGEASNTVTVTATAVDITLALGDVELTKGWIRALVGEDKDIAYTVTGYAGGYNVTFEKSIAGATVAAASTGTAVTVSLDAPNTVVFKVVYTHKSVADKVVTLEIPVSFVSDLEAPVLGEDPFGGTYGTIIPSTGLMLYYDAYTDGTNDTLVTADNVTFAVADTSKLKDLKSDGSVVVEKVSGLQNAWFVLIQDFASNKANGKLSLKMTVTVDGKTAAATKEFDVTAIATDNTKDVTKYMQAVLGDTFQSEIQFIGNADLRQNMILSKTGIVHHRAGGWDLGGDMLRIDLNGIAAQDNTQTFQIDFKFTSLKGNNMELTFGFRTGNWNGWAGSMGFRPNWDGGDNKANEMQVQGWLKGTDGKTDVSGTFAKDADTVPTVGAGIMFYGRVTRTISDGSVVYKAFWSADGSDYKELCSYNVGATNDTNGSAGKYVYALQIAAGGNNGYYLENLNITTPNA